MGLGVVDDGKATAQHCHRANAFQAGNLVLQFELMLGKIVPHGAFKAFARFILELQEGAHALSRRVPLQAVFSEQEVLAQACQFVFQ